MNTKILATLGLLSIAAASLPALADELRAQHVTFHSTSGWANGACLFFQTEEGGGRPEEEVTDATYYVMGFGPSSPYFYTAASEIMMVSTSRYSLRTKTINFTDYGPWTGSWYSDCKDWPNAVARIGQ